MLNPYEMNIFIQCLQFVTKFSFLEYNLVKKSNTPRYSVKTNKNKRLKVYIGIISVVVYVIHFALCCTCIATTDSVTKKVLAGVIMIGIFAATMLRITLMIYTEEIVRIANNIFAIELSKKSNRTRGKIYAFLVVTMSLSAAATSVQSFIIQYSTFAKTSNPLGITLLICFLIVFATICVCDIVANFTVLIPSLITLVDGLQEACLDSFLESKARIHMYRSMQLFNQLHNTAFGTYLLPCFKTSIIGETFLTVYSLIRLRQSLHVAVYAMFFLYIVTLVLVIALGAQLMSAVFNLSSKFPKMIDQQRLRSASEPTSLLFINKTLRSIPRLRCTIGGFYHMEGEAKLTLLDNIARGIAFTLLTV